jgi:uncharacterized protein (TIGR02001 family)
MALTSGAFADGYEGSVKDAPAEAARQFSWSFNVAGTSDYVFRGFSQSARNPTLYLGADAAYGIAYVGVWAAGIEFGDDVNGADVADKEVDLYAGIRPVWKSAPIVGDVTFDFGVIYYWYPNSGHIAVPSGPEGPDYVELKAGYSTSSFIKNLTSGTTVYFSPEGTFKTGEVWTVESFATYTLPAWGPVTPSISGTSGWVKGESNNANFVNFIANGDDSYNYWNAGVTFTADKISFDFRYWDTDIENDGLANGFCKGATQQCDETFVATVKVALP